MPTMESDLPPPPYDSSLLENKGADILVQNAYRNQIWSPLLRLPHKTLIALMKSIDLDSLLRLRHRSRIFMYLFSSEAAFEKYHLTPEEDRDRFEDTARIWIPPSSCFKKQAASPFEGMCPRCARKRQGDIFGKTLLKSMPKQYCSRCRSKHKIMHFSDDQRALPKNSGRICIGHEGHFVLCNYVSMTWHQVKSSEHSRALPVLRCAIHEHSHASLRCGIEACVKTENPGFTVRRHDKYGLYMEVLHSRHILVTRLPSGKICAESSKGT
ncbi:hypothetical protein BB8028_0008g01450 [Beauveria bassiana]|uniref:F-box domain-containing protein n=1 Tax=Beauveria bassiana TaxID=176275 RepID=A0A2S7YN78_BEABA|nr:hypothetical protein BB8028_0008g01450 [Beauveria bassiana]